MDIQKITKTFRIVYNNQKYIVLWKSDGFSTDPEKESTVGL